MRIKEIIKEATEREIQQAVYMEGRCGVLAIAIHQSNPQRYALGYVYEYHVPGIPDMWLDPDEFNSYSQSEKQDVMSNIQNWGLVHAYVFDKETKEYIDARGRSKKIPTLYNLNLTRKNVFPAKKEDIVNITVDMNWNEAEDRWDITQGPKAWQQLGLGDDIGSAMTYAVTHLGVEPVDNPQK